MRVITFDIETISPPGESFDMNTQLITVVGTHDSETDEYKCFEVEEFADLWKLLEGADALVGYNSDHFDIPILNKYYQGDMSRLKSIDLLKEIYTVLDRRIRLDSVAEGTLGMKKSGNGLDAQVWWREGDKERVKKYCLKDVEITRKIFEYALENNKLLYKERGKNKEVPLDTSSWLEKKDSSLTHTIGF
jgi:DEAD/DEAH box helicase domain-containing protein